MDYDWLTLIPDRRYRKGGQGKQRPYQMAMVMWI